MTYAIFDIETVPDRALLYDVFGENELREAAQEVHVETGITLCEPVGKMRRARWDTTHALLREYDVPLPLDWLDLAACKLGSRGTPETFLPYQWHRIAAVAIGMHTKRPDGEQTFDAVTAQGSDEHNLLRILWDHLLIADRVVSYNGRGFDLPVLEMRSLRLGLSVPWYFDDSQKWEACRNRYAPWHLDLADFVTNGGAVRRRPKLDHMLRICGYGGKVPGLDGSQVARLIDEGEGKLVGGYCLLDVVQTTLLYLRIERMRGRLSTAQHNEGVDVVTAWWEGAQTSLPEPLPKVTL